MYERTTRYPISIVEYIIYYREGFKRIVEQFEGIERCSGPETGETTGGRAMRVDGSFERFLSFEGRTVDAGDRPHSRLDI
jgi:hypothetical protein